MRETPGYYDYWPYQDRPKIRWPGGARLAFWVAPNIEFYELDPPANPHRRAWPHPYPAVPGYSIRDYGNRVGHMRQMRLLDKYGIRGSVSLSAALCAHHRSTSPAMPRCGSPPAARSPTTTSNTATTPR